MQHRTTAEQINYHSFLVRIWWNEQEWCGEIEHIQTGECHSFVGLDVLQQLMQTASAAQPQVRESDLRRSLRT